MELSVAFLVSTLLLIVVGVPLYCIYLHPLANVPGPNLAKVSPLWLCKAYYGGKFNYSLLELHKKCGPVVRIAPNELSFATITAQNTIYANTKGHNFSCVGTIFDILGQIFQGTKSVFAHAEKDEHMKLRRIVIPVFTENAVMDQWPILQTHLGHVIARMKGDARSGRVCNLSELIADMMCQIGGDVNFRKPLPEGKNTDVVTSIKPWPFLLLTFLPIVKFFSGTYGCVKFGKALISVLKWSPMWPLPSKLVEAEPDVPNRPPDIRGTIRADKPEDLKNLRVALLNNMYYSHFAVYGTTTTSLCALFHNLLSNPIHLDLLIKELRNNFSYPEDISPGATKHLSYLNACISESLRLYPPVNGQMASRVSPGTFIDGIYVPAGVTVSACPFVVQRIPAHFQMADEFRPDRWVAGARYYGDIKRAHRPFLVGPQSCPGRNMALQTLRMVAAALLFRFDIVPANGDDFDWKRDTTSSLLWTDYAVKAKVGLAPKRTTSIGDFRQLAVYIQCGCCDEAEDVGDDSGIGDLSLTLIKNENEDDEVYGSNRSWMEPATPEEGVKVEGSPSPEPDRKNEGSFSPEMPQFVRT